MIQSLINCGFGPKYAQEIGVSESGGSEERGFFIRKAGRKEFKKEKFVLLAPWVFPKAAEAAVEVLVALNTPLKQGVHAISLTLEFRYSFRHLLTRQKNQPKKMAPQALTPHV